MRELVALLLVVVLIVAGVPVSSQPTSLIEIPIAETVEAGGLEAEIETEGTLSRPASDEFSLNSQFGIGGRSEAGIDLVLGGEEDDSLVLLNAKYLMANRGRTAVAAGIANVGRGSHSRPFGGANTYLVATRRFSLTRFHLGTVHTEDGRKWFAGADGKLSDRLQFMAEYTSGWENFAAAGLRCAFSGTVGLLVGLEFPNSGGDTLLNVQLEFEMPGNDD